MSGPGDMSHSGWATVVRLAAYLEEEAMPHSYALQFRAMVVDPIRSGRRVADVAAVVEVAEAMVYRWVRHDRIDRGQLVGTSTSDNAELRAARQRITELESELAVVKRASVLFDKGRVVRPKRCSRPWPTRLLRGTEASGYAGSSGWCRRASGGDPSHPPLVPSEGRGSATSSPRCTSGPGGPTGGVGFEPSSPSAAVGGSIPSSSVSYQGILGFWRCVRGRSRTGAVGRPPRGDCARPGGWPRDVVTERCAGAVTGRPSRDLLATMITYCHVDVGRQGWRVLLPHRRAKFSRSLRLRGGNYFPLK